MARKMGYPIEGLIEKGKLSVLEYPSLSDERYINELSKEIGTYVIKGCSMVIIDSVTPALKTLIGYARKRAWLHTILYGISKSMNVTMLLIADYLGDNDVDIKLLEFIADVVIRTQYGPRSLFPRRLRILKFRTQPIPVLPIYFEITNNGIKFLTLVESSIAQQIRSKKKLIIEEENPAILFGKEVILGTQIGVIIGPRVPSVSSLFHYFLLKSIHEAITKGLSFGIVFYGLARAAEQISNVAKKFMGDNLEVVFVDFMKGYIQLSQVPDLIKHVILAVLGHEKPAEVFGIREVNNFITFFSQHDKSLGITTIRVYRMNEAQPKVPSALYSMSDIVIECSLDEKTDSIVHRVVKGAHIRKPKVVSDTDIAKDVALLIKKVKEVIPSISELLY